ncbi:NLR, CARD domain-containing protein 3 [Cadophora gregata]|uniref:NLR, CARD domain-containing protein 3 n=1 Tax=Cadophora gregata TaxID=51156 RepID=UPI0026DC5AAB|nr:NLR, CARD domain-containing protein 3 [Cadophora gregata]KAK0101993.1 NLR, CARD domain-containing protein 3 [Cadophora gregata f. sp. sojae]KAK0129266.1 NLR, CARD domain-containing protein 3 [Cadophora gregata]
MSNEEADKERSTSAPPSTVTYESDTSTSSFEDITIEADESLNSSVQTYSPYIIDECLLALRSIQGGDFSNEAVIKALPRRRNKSQRPFALQLGKILFPEASELAALIQYERLTLPAQKVVRQKQRDRLSLELQPKNNAGGKLIRIQGPWAGQDVDPVDLKGPIAIPMPVEIGKADHFEPIFAFLEQDVPFDTVGGHETSKPGFEFAAKNKEYTGTRGVELLWKSSLLEFERGIVYDDGRLDLCKKVVGPTHIGQLMKSLESNNQIKHFLLGNNAISSTGAKMIADFIAKYPNRMETWYLAGCHITRTGLQMLASQMTASTSITNLWFKRNPLGAGSSLILADLVLHTKNLRTLDLETTELGDEGVRQFIDAIAGKPSSLQNLYLNANGIGQSACASLSTYLASPECVLESLFLSTNPIGDAGMALLAPGLSKNKTLKRLTLASAGLTSKGVTTLAKALTTEAHPFHTLDLGASQTTKAHSQKFNYLDDSCIEALKPLILSPSLRSLNLGRTVFSLAGMQEIRSTAAQSELVQFAVNHVQVTNTATTSDGIFEGTNAPKSCSLEVRNRLVKNQAKYYPHIENYDDFLNSEELRFLRNTPDVRKIDSMYRTQDKRLGLPMDEPWKEGDPVWKLITEDAEKWERKLAGTA